MNNQKPLLVVASGNAAKLREIAEILTDYTVISMKQAGFTGDPEETGETFLENALIKAKTVATALNLPALADDSGLCVDALDGAPGVYSARFAGGHGDDEANNDKVLDLLKSVPEAERGAKFCSAVVLCYPNGTYISGYGETHGRILFEREGTQGFGYDPLFFNADLQKSFGIATAQEKNGVSHRYRALMDLKGKL